VGCRSCAAEILAVLQLRFAVVLVHQRDDIDGNFLRACGFTLTVVRARTEVLIHGLDHCFDTLVTLGLTLWKAVKVRHLCCSEQVRCTVRAGRHTRSATNALGRVHCRVGNRLRDGYEVRIWCTTGGRRDEATRFDDAIERRTIDHEVLDDWERRCAPWLDDNGVATLELAHVQLTSGRAALVAVGLAIDHQRARATNTFATIVVEHDSFLAVIDETLIQDVEHLEERCLVADLFDGVILEVSRIIRALLAPHAQGEVGQMIAHL